MIKTVFILFTLLALFAFGFNVHTHFTPKHQGSIGSNFDGEYFHNSNLDPNDKRSAIDLLTWFCNRQLEPWTNLPFTRHSNIVERSDNLRITWINHATVLIQLNNVNILTDPMWSERASPLSWIGPKRLAPPPIKIYNLPHIDLVIVSHNHYDHMDLPSLQRLNEYFRPVFITPLNNQHYLRSVGISKVVELDWWQSHETNLVQISATPAQHWSKRTLFDANRALWSGFYIQGSTQSAFFAGDTAYEEHFKKIKQKLGEPTVALLTIGAYKPEWFMKRAHTSPEEAVLAHMDLNAFMSIPIHYGAFQIGNDSPQSALMDLDEAAKKYRLANDAFHILKPGETLSVPTSNELALSVLQPTL